MSVSIVTADPELDERRRRGLRRMRTLAVALLLLAAVVYLLTLGRHGFLGFVNAGAEASMVGAIADWFAVTALFKHPLGLPVPHTALIPRRKDELGRSLEEFVGENFLQETIIRERIAAAELSRRVGDWLSVEDNARRAVDEAAAVLHIGLGKVRDQDLVALIEEALLPRFRAEPVSPVAGSLLQEIVRDGAHHGLVDLALEEAQRWLTRTRRPSSRSSPSGHPGGRRLRSTTGSPTASTSRWWSGWRRSAGTPTTTPGRPSTARSRSWPRTCSTTSRPRTGWSGSRSGCCRTRSWW